MSKFETMRVPAAPVDVAPDGTEVRPLLTLASGGLAHFELAPGKTSQAVTHRTVEETWFFLRGRGEMWRRQGKFEEVVEVGPDVCLTIPLGTHFQFRCFGYEPLAMVIATMPPRPGRNEAYVVEGKWVPTVAPAAHS
jgi:mannose-6-phosphate isomerase-like protein (cupin superfamily)